MGWSASLGGELKPGDFVEVRKNAGEYDKARITHLTNDGFVGVYGYQTDGRFFECPVELDQLRLCEECPKSSHPSGLCETHRRLVQ